MMRAWDPQVKHAVLAAIGPLLPQRVPDRLGRGRPRVSDELCLYGIWLKLISGMSWESIEATLDHKVSDTTLRARRDEWTEAGVFEQLLAQAWDAYDRIIGFDLHRVVIDGSQHRAPCGGEGTGINPFDRGKLGWKWVVAVDGGGIPLGFVTDGANRNDYALLLPVLDATFANHPGLTIERLHLDRGFSYDCTPSRLANYNIGELIMKPRQPRGKKNTKTNKKLVGFGENWIVESTNSWFTNYGQLRRSTDRKIIHRLTAIQLAVTILIIGRLIDHRDLHQTRTAA